MTPIGAQQQMQALNRQITPEMPLNAPTASPSPTQYPTPPLSPTSQGSPNNAQLDAILKSLGGISEGLGKLPQQQIQQPSVSADTKALEDAYLASATPTTEEEATQKQLSNLLASRDLGLIGAESQPIPLQAIMGQQEKIMKQF